MTKCRQNILVFFRQCVDAMLEAGFSTRQQIADDLERPAETLKKFAACLMDTFATTSERWLNSRRLRHPR